MPLALASKRPQPGEAESTPLAASRQPEECWAQKSECNIDFRDGTLDYTVALTRKSAGEYQVKRESAKLEPTDSGVRPVEVSLTNGQLTKPNLKRILEQAESTGTEDIGRGNGLAGIVNRSSRIRIAKTSY